MGENNVEVNPEKIQADLASAGAGSTPLEGEHIPRGSAQPGEQGGAAPDAGQVGVDWTEAAIGIVWIIDSVVVPNWKLEADEKTALAEGTTKVLKAFFPTITVDPRIAAVLALLTVAGVITARRIDSETGELTPPRAPPAEPESPDDATRKAA